MNLEQTWENCLAMWKWISENWDGCNVHELKKEWLEEHGFSKIPNDCFFCEYDDTERCQNCPGRLVDRDFSCQMVAYHYADRPVEFYNKLLELNSRRTGMKMTRNEVREAAETSDAAALECSIKHWEELSELDPTNLTEMDISSEYCALCQRHTCDNCPCDRCSKDGSPYMKAKRAFQDHQRFQTASGFPIR